MRRLASLALVASAAAAALGSLGAGEDRRGAARVDAIFDNASGLIPGQDVKVAGARVGVVREITLTGERRARVEMEMDGRFLPFRRDAECSIRPQSLIGEKFVQCSPGSPATGELAGPGETPTVPVERTHAPIDLDLVFAALRLPYRERLAIILNELGAGLAGRGGDLNAVIRRANPALQDARRLLAILDRQRADLQGAIESTDAILEPLAARRDRLAGFIGQAAAVTRRTAAHRGEIERTVARLPELLEQAEPALVELDGLAVEATPVLQDLERSAPGIRRLFRDFEPLATAARPALDRLGEAAATGRRALEAAGPAVAELRPVASLTRAQIGLAAELLRSLVTKGYPEGLQRFVYYAASATSRFDATSHILPAHFVLGECSNYNTGQPTPACEGRFGEFQTTNATSKRRRKRSPAGGGQPRRIRRTPGAGPPVDRQDPRPEPPGPRPKLPRLPNLEDPETTAEQLLDFLLGN